MNMIPLALLRRSTDGSLHVEESSIDHLPAWRQGPVDVNGENGVYLFDYASNVKCPFILVRRGVRQGELLFYQFKSGPCRLKMLSDRTFYVHCKANPVYTEAVF